MKFYKYICILFLFTILILLFFSIFMVYKYETKECFENKISNIANQNYVFLGDSITEGYALDKYYKNIPIVNSGIGGNQTKDILNDMNNRVYRYNPTKVFLLIGTNDLSNKISEKEIFNNIVKIVDLIKKNRPFTKIYVESIYPVNQELDSDMESQTSDEKNAKIDSINSKLKKKYKNTDVTYIDINSKLKDENGRLKKEYTKEGLHLTSSGYLKVTKELLIYLMDNN